MITFTKDDFKKFKLEVKDAFILAMSTNQYKIEWDLSKNIDAYECAENVIINFLDKKPNGRLLITDSLGEVHYKNYLVHNDSRPAVDKKYYYICGVSVEPRQFKALKKFYLENQILKDNIKKLNAEIKRLSKK